MNTLTNIIERKRRDVEEAKSRVSLDAMKARARESDSPRNFFRAITERNHARGSGNGPSSLPNLSRHADVAVIAEIKRKSPSAGWIRDEYRDDDAFDPGIIAKAYHRAGASAISCLTDEPYFGGHLGYIQQIRQAVTLPVLRKDFIVDEYQVWEARAAGADAILLIAEVLPEGELLDLMILAQKLRMTTLVEVHEVESLLKVKRHIGFPHAGYSLLGINNRNLRTMQTDIGHTFRMLDMIDDTSVVVSESGITSYDDLVRLRQNGVRIALVGEHLMRQPDPGQALQAMLVPTGHSAE